MTDKEVNMHDGHSKPTVDAQIASDDELKEPIIDLSKHDLDNNAASNCFQKAIFHHNAQLIWTGKNKKAHVANNVSCCGRIVDKSNEAAIEVNPINEELNDCIQFVHEKKTQSNTDNWTPTELKKPSWA